MALLKSESEDYGHHTAKRNTDPSVLAAERIHTIEGNVWEWIHEIAANSPVKPTANLGTGFIEYNPPDFIIQAHKNALDNVEDNQYAPMMGTKNLKKAISDVYSPLYGRTLDPVHEISVHSGAQEGLLSCVMGFIQAGDEVILLEPVFELYVYQTKFAGGTARYVPMRPPSESVERTVAGNDWVLDMKELEAAITPKSKMLILNNPHNPLGKVFNRSELLSIGNLCVKHNLILVSDEAYEHLSFHEPFIRVAALSPEIEARTLTAVSLGKLFNATGWRVGFVVGPPHLMKYVQHAHIVTAYASSTPAQEACAIGLKAAAKNGFWKQNKMDVEKRVGRICDALDELGLSFVRPNGAYFIFVNISKIQIPESYNFPAAPRPWTRDYKVCFFLVQEYGITSIPGSCFFCERDGYLGNDYIRFGACKSDQGLALAEERLRKLKPLIAG